MSLETMRTRLSEDCLSDRRLDALLADELDGALREQADAHLHTCARCAARRDALAVDAGTFLRQHPAPPVVRTRPRTKALAWWSAGLAAAAAVLLFVRQPAEPGLRSKGAGGSVGFFVRHGERVRRGASGEHVVPGDALRFVITQERASYVAVLSRDGAGQVSVYYPAGEAAALVPAGVEQALDASVILDDVLGEEHLHALRCREAVALAPLQEALAAGRPRWPDTCHVERITLVKQGGL